MTQRGKILSDEGLKKDLAYLTTGIDCHEILRYIQAPRPGLVVLEAGCGSGKLGLWYSVRKCDVTLMDIDDQALLYASHLAALAEKWYDHPVDANLVHGSVLKMPETWTGVFDFVMSEGVCHHWGYNPKDTRRQRAINEMVRVARPGGKIAIIGSNSLCPATMKMAETTEHTYPGMPPRQKPFEGMELFGRLMRAGCMDAQVAPVTDFFAYMETTKMAPITGTYMFWKASPLLVGWGTKRG